MSKDLILNGTFVLNASFKEFKRRRLSSWCPMRMMLSDAFSYRQLLMQLSEMKDSLDPEDILLYADLAQPELRA